MADDLKTRLRAGWLSLKNCAGLSEKFGGYNTLSEAANEIERLERDLAEALKLRAEWNDAAMSRISELESELASTLEDRARFPDRPDKIGTLISAHIGNLKACKESSDEYARKAMSERNDALGKIRELEERIAELEGPPTKAAFKRALPPFDVWEG